MQSHYDNHNPEYPEEIKVTVPTVKRAPRSYIRKRKLKVVAHKYRKSLNSKQGKDRTFYEYEEPDGRVMKRLCPEGRQKAKMKASEVNFDRKRRVISFENDIIDDVCKISGHSRQCIKEFFHALISYYHYLFSLPGITYTPVSHLGVLYANTSALPDHAKHCLRRSYYEKDPFKAEEHRMNAEIALEKIKDVERIHKVNGRVTPRDVNSTKWKYTFKDKPVPPKMVGQGSKKVETILLQGARIEDFEEAQERHFYLYEMRRKNGSDNNNITT